MVVLFGITQYPVRTSLWLAVMYFAVLLERGSVVGSLAFFPPLVMNELSPAGNPPHVKLPALTETGSPFLAEVGAPALESAGPKVNEPLRPLQLIGLAPAPAKAD